MRKYSSTSFFSTLQSMLGHSIQKIEKDCWNWSFENPNFTLVGVVLTVEKQNPFHLKTALFGNVCLNVFWIWPDFGPFTTYQRLTKVDTVLNESVLFEDPDICRGRCRVVTERVHNLDLTPIFTYYSHSKIRDLMKRNLRLSINSGRVHCTCCQILAGANTSTAPLLHLPLICFGA